MGTRWQADPDAAAGSGSARVRPARLGAFATAPGSAGHGVALPLIQQHLATDMAAVDRVIRERLHSEVALVSQVADYIISAGGKRLRPALVVLASRAHGVTDARAHELAAIIEFIHTATLLHDDVVDESALRRGRETANAAFGNAPAVLVGDFLYSRAFQMMVGIGSMRVMEVLADATNIIAEGEVLQLMNCNDPDIDEAAYLQVIRYKTAKLFEASTRLGAVLGGAGEVREAAMAAYGMHLGTAFQLVDDILDYSGDPASTGKNVGDDLAEGKPTLPLIHAIRHGNVAEAALVRSAIEQGGCADIDAVLAAIRRTGALDYARSVAEAELGLARAALETLEPSPDRDVLLSLTVFAADRDR
ncbi:MAG: octaprenyl diphosphate synthase [Rhodocyclaceae bacterium]|nr:octaprenyl diphosphate synthase [Rhodocyclaceae bacterium]